MPVRVKRAEVLPGFGVVNFVEGDFRVPGFNRGLGLWMGDRGFLGDGDSEKFPGDEEHAVHDAVDGEVGAESFVVDGVLFLTLHLGVVGDFPWLQRLGLLGSHRQALLGCFVEGQLLGFLQERRFDPVVELLDESDRVVAVASHATLEDEGGEIPVA